MSYYIEFHLKYNPEKCFVPFENNLPVELLLSQEFLNMHVVIRESHIAARQVNFSNKLPIFYREASFCGGFGII